MTTTHITTDPELPSVQQVVDFIESEAFDHARSKMTGIRFLEIDEENRAFTVSKNTPLEATIRVAPDGTIEAPRARYHQRLRSSKHARTNNFKADWTEILEQARKHVVSVTHDFLKLDAPGADHGLQGIYDSAPVQAAIYKTSNGVRSTLGQGYLTEPSRLAHGLLHKILGKDRVSQALAIAGSAATIADLNIITKNEDAFRKAHELNPNATVLWFDQNQGADTWNLTPEQIIDQARATFEKTIFISQGPDAADRTPALESPWETISRQCPNRSGRTATAEQAWTAFSNLNHLAFNHRPSPSKNFLGDVIATVIAAGAEPSYSALSHALYHHHGDLKFEPITRSFLKESGERARNRSRGTQRELIHQFNQIVDTYRHKWGPTHETIREVQQQVQRLNQEAGDATLPWETWTQAMPQELMAELIEETARKPRKSPAKTGSTKAASTKARTAKAPAAKAPAANPSREMELREFMDGPLGRELHALLQGTVRVDLVPGQSAALTAGAGAPPSLVVERRANGTIQVQTNGYWNNKPDLPATRAPEREGRQPQLGHPGRGQTGPPRADQEVSLQPRRHHRKSTPQAGPPGGTGPPRPSERPSTSSPRRAWNPCQTMRPCPRNSKRPLPASSTRRPRTTPGPR